MAYYNLPAWKPLSVDDASAWNWTMDDLKRYVFQRKTARHTCPCHSEADVLFVCERILEPLLYEPEPLGSIYNGNELADIKVSFHRGSGIPMNDIYGASGWLISVTDTPAGWQTPDWYMERLIIYAKLCVVIGKFMISKNNNPNKTVRSKVTPHMVSLLAASVNTAGRNQYHHGAPSLCHAVILSSLLGNSNPVKAFEKKAQLVQRREALTRVLPALMEMHKNKDTKELLLHLEQSPGNCAETTGVLALQTPNMHTYALGTAFTTKSPLLAGSSRPQWSALAKQEKLPKGFVAPCTNCQTLFNQANLTVTDPHDALTRGSNPAKFVSRMIGFRNSTNRGACGIEVPDLILTCDKCPLIYCSHECRDGSQASVLHQTHRHQYHNGPIQNGREAYLYGTPKVQQQQLAEVQPSVGPSLVPYGYPYPPSTPLYEMQEMMHRMQLAAPSEYLHFPRGFPHKQTSLPLSTTVNQMFNVSDGNRKFKKDREKNEREKNSGPKSVTGMCHVMDLSSF